MIIYTIDHLLSGLVLLLLADRYSVLNLKKIVLEFIRFHSTDAVKTSGRKKLNIAISLTQFYLRNPRDSHE